MRDRVAEACLCFAGVCGIAGLAIAWVYCPWWVGLVMSIPLALLTAVSAVSFSIRRMM